MAAESKRASAGAPSRAQLRAALLALLAERAPATACPSEVARKMGGAGWRALMPLVRDVAAGLSARVEALQRGQRVDPLRAKGPLRLRLRAPPAAAPYQRRRGEQGVFQVEPYKSELLPLWRFRTPALARQSAKAIHDKFVAYGRAGDAAGMDMARKYLQMGWTRARRYANHPSGRKRAAGGEELPRVEDPVKAEAAAIFKRYYDRARANRTYQKLFARA